MPHNQSVRKQRRSKQEHDMVPGRESIIDEAVPKSVARVLGAAKVRGEWNAKKRGNCEMHPAGVLGEEGRVPKKRKNGVDDSGPRPVPLTIQPGETLSHFNRRVESDMRPAVNSAIRSSTKRQRKRGSRALPQDVTSPTSHRRTETPLIQNVKSDRPTEFPTASSTAPRRLNEVVGAPPNIKRIPRGAISAGKGNGVISMAQKASMDAEREMAILRYKEMKEKARIQLQTDQGVDGMSIRSSFRRAS